MKILLIDNSSLTPIGESLCCEPKTGGFALELQNLGNQVTMYGQIVKQENNIHSFDIENHDISVVGYMRKKNKLINYIFLYLMVIPNIIKSDFIYIFYPSAFKYVAILCWLLGKPYGLYVRGENDLQSSTSKFIYKRSKVVFTVTEYFTNFIKKIIRKDNVFSIRPMISLSDNDIIYNKDYKSKNKIKILFLARVEKDKGIEELLYAFYKLKEKYDFEAEIVGAGEFLQYAIDIANDLALSDIVKFRGAIFDDQKLKNFYVNSDLYILPTYHEGFPRTLYEAMIFGTPIITTFVGGISGIMKHQYNCLEIKSKSVSSIVDAIEYAIQNYSEMEKYAYNGLKTVAPIVDSSRLSHAQHLNMLIKKTALKGYIC